MTKTNMKNRREIYKRMVKVGHSVVFLFCSSERKQVSQEHCVEVV